MTKMMSSGKVEKNISDTEREHKKTYSSMEIGHLLLAVWNCKVVSSPGGRSLWKKQERFMRDWAIGVIK